MHGIGDLAGLEGGAQDALEAGFILGLIAAHRLDQHIIGMAMGDAAPCPWPAAS